ncbi:hypothetical protein, partial [Agathobaculum desmolans]|uniref:hypothetical protein n=1 Tax=Agathobaculum desmolans TaxID=39484 RepID=UPI00248E2D1B
RHLAKVEVASSSLVSRSMQNLSCGTGFFYFSHLLYQKNRRSHPRRMASPEAVEKLHFSDNLHLDYVGHKREKVPVQKLFSLKV